MADEIVYKDIPMSFAAHPLTGNLAVLTDADAVKNSIKNLVLTNFGERSYNYTLGGDVVSQLFENADSFTEYTVSKKIRTVIKNYEPRAILDDVQVFSNPDQNSLSVTIKFRLRNNREPLQITVLLERIR